MMLRDLKLSLDPLSDSLSQLIFWGVDPLRCLTVALNYEIERCDDGNTDLMQCAVCQVDDYVDELTSALKRFGEILDANETLGIEFKTQRARMLYEEFNKGAFRAPLSEIPWAKERIQNLQKALSSYEQKVASTKELLTALMQAGGGTKRVTDDGQGAEEKKLGKGNGK